jgi:hypothetical protein
LPAIYQFHEQHGASQVQFESAILNGFRGMPVSRVGISLPRRPKKHRAQETEDENETSTAAGKVIFLTAFRNLPPVHCVPMPEQDFILGTLAVSGETPRVIAAMS